MSTALAISLTAVGIAPASAMTADTGTVSVKVVAPGGTPIPDAWVTVNGVDVDWNGPYNTSDDGITSASGIFKSVELSPGTYDVTASLPSPAAMETKHITITADTDGATTLTLTNIQAIKGTVTAKGKAVGSGTVNAYTAGYKDTYSAQLSKGKYVLLVKPGTYTVSATPDYDATTKTWLTTYAGNTVREIDATKVKVTKDKPSTVNIAAYDKLGKLTGTVVDSKGKAVKNANVSVAANNRSGWGTATSDAKGAFTITGLPAATYDVYSSNTAYTATSTTTKKVTAGKTTKAKITLKSTAAHKGKVILTLKAPKALIKDRRACATLLDSKGDRLWIGPYDNCLSNDGKGKTITFDNLPAGKYTLVLNGANTSKAVTVKKNKTTKVAMTRTAGTTITGKVTTSAGKALPKTSVYILDGKGTYLGGATTNAKGAYTISGAVKGKYTVYASAVKPSHGATTSKSVTLSGKKKTVNVRLTKGATITGKVVNSKGKPVAGVDVRTSSGDGRSWASATTDAKGAYTLRGLAPGMYVVTTYDYYEGGYFNGKAAKKKVASGKKVTLSTIKIKS